MELFTLEEYKFIAEVIDNAPLHGTIHTLPSPLSKLTHIRIKLQGLIEAMQKEYVENLSPRHPAGPVTAISGDSANEVHNE